MLHSVLQQAGLLPNAVPCRLHCAVCHHEKDNQAVGKSAQPGQLSTIMQKVQPCNTVAEMLKKLHSCGPAQTEGEWGDNVCILT